jgi:hypothetical protein
MKMRLTILALLCAFIALISAGGQEAENSVETSSEAQLRLSAPGPPERKEMKFMTYSFVRKVQP